MTITQKECLEKYRRADNIASEHAKAKYFM